MNKKMNEGIRKAQCLENKKVKISESELKNIIRESIEEIMTGDYINQGIDKQWANPNSQLRQFGDEWLRATLDLCKKYDSAIHPQELISLMKPIAVKIIMKKRQFGIEFAVTLSRPIGKK